MRARARLLALVAVSVVVLSSCGGGSNGASTPKDAARPWFLLDAKDVTTIARGRPSVAAMVTFWRAVQFQDYPRAYTMLVRRLRTAVTYPNFINLMSRARPFFLTRPQVLAVEAQTADTVKLYILVRQSPSPRPADPPVIIELRRAPESSLGWQIDGDPANTLLVG